MLLKLGAIIQLSVASDSNSLSMNRCLMFHSCSRGDPVRLQQHFALYMQAENARSLGDKLHVVGWNFTKLQLSFSCSIHDTASRMASAMKRTYPLSTPSPQSKQPVKKRADFPILKQLDPEVVPMSLSCSTPVGLNSVQSPNTNKKPVIQLQNQEKTVFWL